MNDAWELLKAKKKSKPFHGYNPNKHHRKGGLSAKVVLKQSVKQEQILNHQLLLSLVNLNPALKKPSVESHFVQE